LTASGDADNLADTSGECRFGVGFISLGGGVLNHKSAARLPDRLRFTRNGREADAHRVQLGEIEVVGRELRVADATYEDEVSPLPVRVPNGLHAIHVYLWEHPRGSIPVCVVMAFLPQRLAVARPLVIDNNMRADLTDGIIVDSGEVRIGSASSITLASGLGDGYYPLHGIYNFGLFVQAVVLDFKVWQVRKMGLLPGQTLDEFGIVRRISPDAEPDDG
jgi:hypothetical protein